MDVPNVGINDDSWNELKRRSVMHKWATKKTKDSSPSTTQKSKKGKSSGGMPAAKPSDPRLLDIAAMNFGKFAYRGDQQYKNLKPLMENYNSCVAGSKSREGGQQLLAATKTLLDECYKYIEANTTGEKEQHKGRCENVENVIFHISMAGNVLGRAETNIRNMSDEADWIKDDYSHLKDDNERKAAEAKETSKAKSEINTLMGGISEAVHGDGVSGEHKHSKLMGMIAANVMASQDKTKFNLGTSGTKSHYAVDGDKRDYTHDVGSRADLSTAQSTTESIGSAFHEFTHANVSHTFGGNDMFMATKRLDNGTLDRDSVTSEMAQRVKEANELKQIGLDQSKKLQAKGKDTSSIDAAVAYADSQILDYGLSDRKKIEYINGEHTNELQNIYNVLKDQNVTSDLVNQTQQYENGRLHWTKAFHDTHDIKKTEKTVQAGSLTMTQVDKEWQAKADVNPDSLLSLTNYNTKHADEKADITIDKLDKGSQEKLMTEFNEQLRNSNVSDEVKTKLYHDAVQLTSYNEIAASNYDAMIEFDSVVNQALLNYERLNPSDRSSQYYRKLKAMALRAHIRRLEQRLENEEGQVDRMANDPYRNLTPSAKGSLIDRAYERRSDNWAHIY